MKCSDVAKLIAGGSIQAKEVQDHIATCSECREMTEFDGWLKTAFNQDMELRPGVLERVAEDSAKRTVPPQRSILKKTVWTACGALVLALGFTALLAPSAQASTAKEKFNKVIKAIREQQNRTSIHLKFSSDTSGKPKSMIYVNGRFMDAIEGVPTEYNNGIQQVVITQSSDLNKGLESLPPEEQQKIRKQIEDMMAGKGNNGADSSFEQFVINGKKVTKEEADKFLKSQGIDLKIDFNFDEASYSSISFGANENTLMLVPKNHSDVRYSMSVDPKTNLPSAMAMQSSQNGNWTTVKNSNFEYKPKGAKP